MNISLLKYKYALGLGEHPSFLTSLLLALLPSLRGGLVDHLKVSHLGAQWHRQMHYLLQQQDLAY